MRKVWIVVFLSLFMITSFGCSSKEEDLGDEFLINSDNQYYFCSPLVVGAQMAESEDCYYFLGGSYLFSKDKETGEVSVLCNKPDCLHDKEEDGARATSCNAFFFGTRAFYYNNNKLYVLSEEVGSIGTTSQGIYEIDVTGSTRKQVFKAKEPILNFIVHRNYLYLSFSDFLESPDSYDAEKLSSSSYRVERYPLNGSSGQSEVIYEQTGKHGQINTMSAYGNQVYFVVGLENDTERLVYSLQDHTVTPFPQKLISSMPVIDHQLLFFERIDLGNWTDYEVFKSAYQDKKAIIADLKGNPVQELELPFSTDLFSNGDLIISDNIKEVRCEYIPREDRAIQIYDKTGTLMKELKTGSDTMPALGMNEDYFFYLKRPQNENGQTEIWAVDLHKLNDPNLEGEAFFCYVPPMNHPGVVTE